MAGGLQLLNGKGAFLGRFKGLLSVLVVSALFVWAKKIGSESVRLSTGTLVYSFGWHGLIAWILFILMLWSVATGYRSASASASTVNNNPYLTVFTVGTLLLYPIVFSWDYGILSSVEMERFVRISLFISLSISTMTILFNAKRYKSFSVKCFPLNRRGKLYYFFYFAFVTPFFVVSILSLISPSRIQSDLYYDYSCYFEFIFIHAFLYMIFALFFNISRNK